MNILRRVQIRGILLALLFCMAFWHNTARVSAMGLEDIFDPEEYYESNLDVADSMEPDRELLFRHFLSYGLAEGRSPGNALDVAKYRAVYPDLEEAFGDDWDSYVQHYVAVGIKEGRSNFALFSPIPYADANPDVKAAYGYDETALITHYLVFGIREHRPLFPKEEKLRRTTGGNDNSNHNAGSSDSGGSNHDAGSSDSGGSNSNAGGSDSGDSNPPKSISLSKSDTYPELLAGNTTQIVADLQGYDDETVALLWEILTGGCAPGTLVDESGSLYIDQNETNERITVKAQDSNIPEISDTIDYDIFHIDRMLWNGVESTDEIWSWSGANLQIGDEAVKPDELPNELALYDGEQEVVTELSWHVSSPESFEGEDYEEAGTYVYEATITCSEFEVPDTFTYSIEVTA